jgi:hypothetical protein
MKKLSLVILLFIGFSNGIKAQKVFSVDYSSQATIKVFVVKYESQCDLKVYKVKYESQADLKIYFVDYESQAGWKNSSKKSLLY